MTGKFKNNVSGLASRWKKPAKASSRAYRNADSLCDVNGHVGQYLCIRCPFPDGCLHMAEDQYEKEKDQVELKPRQSVYADCEDYQ